MKTTKFLFSFLITYTSLAQFTLPHYYARNDFLFASSGALKTGLYGFDNPAMLSYQHQFDATLMWSNLPGQTSKFRRWGLFAAFPNAGFAMVRETMGSSSITDYRFSLAAGDRTLSAGLGFGWSSGDRGVFPRSNLYTLGILYRPNRYMSAGTVWTLPTRGNSSDITFDVALRPLGSELLTFFADYMRENQKTVGAPTWSSGAVVEVAPGIRLTGRYFESKSFTVGLQLNLGNLGLSSQVHYDKSGDHSYNTYALRLGAYDRNILRRSVDRNTKYLELNLQGAIDYQRYMFFDSRKTLSGLVNAIDAAKTDPSVAGIAINTSAMAASSELLYELREKLAEFRATGKKVIMFIDRPSLPQYYFASVADKIVMDPYGTLAIQGIIAGRMFLKGTFEKIGVGVDELRFFKYKSAAETLSREKMSEADREQRQALIDDIYGTWKDEICRSRNLAAARFDEIVNNDFALLPEQAVSYGLVDTLGRWETVKEMMKKLEGEEKRYTSAASLERFNLPPDNSWGEKPQIAVIYALGICAMDEGIHARRLVRDVQAALENPRIRAIVLRVDSPGGDPMASDYIALALKKAKGKKPIIVSQGNVAASGGYWLSMYADTIIAAPVTVTGSIGVIGSWLYNNGLKESLGISTDFVKVGDHADLGFGFALPFLGGLPDRGLTPEERSRVEGYIKTLYTDFVGKVAEGRKKKPDEIEAIAQGRVWSGIDGMQNGLVDGLGTLETAITVARGRAGLAEYEVTIVEYPKLGLFDPGAFLPRLIGIEAPPEKDRTLELIKFYMNHNGKPMPILPMEDLLMMEIPER